MTDDLITQTVLDCMQRRQTLPGASLEEKLACAYLDEGLLDSMQVVEMIVHLERTLDLKFQPQDLQSEEFRTVGGVISTLRRLRSAS